MNNIILIIISSLLAATKITINGEKTCPQYWWPLSVNNSLIYDVMNKKAITTVSCSFVNDRIAYNPVNLNSIYIKASDNDANTNYLTLPQEKYFNSTSFTIIFWINLFTVPSAGKQARVIDFSDADTKKNGIAVFIQPGTTSANVSIDNSSAVVLETVVDGAITAVSDKGAGFALKTWTHVAITVSTSGSTITIAIYYNGSTTDIKLSNATAISKLPAETTSFTTNFIGNGAKLGNNEVSLDAYLNDVKIFDSALSATQVSSQYTSEKSTRSYTCSSSSTNPKYFYIVLFAILISFV